jgi:hypothetical protein
MVGMGRSQTPTKVIHRVASALWITPGADKSDIPNKPLISVKTDIWGVSDAFRYVF